MKKWLMIGLILLLTGCSETEQADKASEEDNPQTYVAEQVGKNDVDTTESDDQLDPTQQVIAAIDKLQSKTELKFGLSNITQFHPELDKSERNYEMVYAPNEPYVYKKYEDNYFAAKYESYLTSEGELYVKNEFGNNTWTSYDGRFVVESDLSQTIGELLSSIVTQADTVDIQEEMNGPVAFVYMTEGDFKQVEKRYIALSDTIEEIVATEEILKNFNDGEESAYNFYNVALEIYLSANNEIDSYKLIVDFNEGEENFIIFEQIFNDISPASDFKAPADLAS